MPALRRCDALRPQRVTLERHLLPKSAAGPVPAAGNCQNLFSIFSGRARMGWGQFAHSTANAQVQI
jgi:hypothetical protein